MIKGIVPYIAAAAMMVSAGSNALAAECFNSDIIGQMKVQQLDILLMVNSLRCRTTRDDFQADYDAFQIRHNAEMGQRISEVLTELAHNSTKAQARVDLEQARTVMANRAAQPTALSCADFKQLTAQLAMAPEDKVTLAADVLVSGSLAVAACPVQVAVATPK